MTDDKYEMSGSKFSIVDAELGIAVDGEWEQEEASSHPGGKVRSVAYKKEGELHGPSRYFGADGQLLSETWYVYGKRMGKVRRFYPNRQLFSVERFYEDIPHGTQEFFYLDGTKKGVIPYSQGKFHGEVTLYWPDGSIKRRCTYEEGKQIGKDQMFDEEGVPIA